MSLPREVASELTKIENMRHRAARRKATAQQAPVPLPAPAQSKVCSASDLMGRVFAPVKWAVIGLLLEGVTIFAGRPKLGKSWLALNIAVAVASGGRALGSIPVEQGEVLYLALEDGERRLQERLRTVAFDGAPTKLYFATDWKRFDEGGELDLKEWLIDHPDARLIVIDTLKRIRPKERFNARLYDGDYDALSPIADLARKFGVSILVVHHTRKADSEDPLDLVSGSLGLTGAADGVLVLKRTRGQADAVLHATGRDFEDKELALRWDADLTGWIVMGDAQEYQMSNGRREVIDLFRAQQKPLTPKAVSEILGRDRNSTKKLLWSMSKDGDLRADNRGQYSLSSTYCQDVYIPANATDAELEAICGP
jgi:hypothetical protein